ncbi:YmdB family metallophosphoesterase [Patescibacteria group bacterium]|nr:YmdB family metallophosphoesterase [Patescibacteria group bacterium]MBU1868653.1 YmdB family metallophosphoesterase [Patescibacteria group bacterium]
MKILFIGDIVSKLGREAIKKVLPGLKRQEGIDLAFANAENLAGGRGVTENTLYEMLDAGVDYFTSGNHIFRQENWESLLQDENFRLLRPANYPCTTPGRGVSITQTPQGQQVLLINLLGKTFFNPNVSQTTHCPYETIDNILQTYAEESLAAIVIDFHAESTSEKLALGLYTDGKASMFVGTHTHIPTADARILPAGTAYVTDVGMAGPLNSVLGVKKEIIWNLYRYPRPQRFEWVKNGRTVFQSVLVNIKSRNASDSITRNDIILEDVVT